MGSLLNKLGITKPDDDDSSNNKPAKQAPPPAPKASAPRSSGGSLLNKLGITKPDDPSPAAAPVDEDSKPTPKASSSKKAVVSDDSDKTPTLKVSGGSNNFYKALNKALADNSTDGFDYLKFRDALHSMEKRIPDEEARFEAASASAKTMKVSPDDLVDSAQNFLKVASSEQAKFNKAVNSLMDDNAEKQDELKKVVKDLADLQDKKASLEKEIADSKSKAVQQKSDFDDAYDQVTGEIKQDISKIKKYLIN